MGQKAQGARMEGGQRPTPLRRSYILSVEGQTIMASVCGVDAGDAVQQCHFKAGTIVNVLRARDGIALHPHHNVKGYCKPVYAFSSGPMMTAMLRQWSDSLVVPPVKVQA